MKNIHVLPTDKPTWLHKSLLSGVLRKSSSCIDDMKQAQGMNIYITSDEEIKDGDYALYLFGNLVQKVKIGINVSNKEAHKKIILTTDPDLIKDGVQAIDDEFLEWLVKNPSCEFVDVERTVNDYWHKLQLHYEFKYKIIIPQEEPKQKTLEEACDKVLNYLYPNCKKEMSSLQYGNSINSLKSIAKWQQERMYSEEEVLELLNNREQYLIESVGEFYQSNLEWFEQFKKK